MARTFYDVLFVTPHADRELLSTVYRHLAKRYHPDRDASPQAAKRMAELNQAYEVLSDPQKRARYDVQAGLRPAQRSIAPPRRDGRPTRAGSGRPTRAGGANAAAPTGPYGEAGAPPANPLAKGRPLTFGRYRGWTLNQVARYDHDYIEWLSRTTLGRNHKTELDGLLRRAP